MARPDPDDAVCVGAVAGAFGVRGEVRLKSFCSDPEAIFGYGPLIAEGAEQTRTVTLTRRVKGAFACRMSEVSSREQAEALKGTRLYVPRDRLPELPDDEFYHADLIGLDVMDTGGTRIGRLSSVDDHGAGDVLEISGPGLAQPILLPFTRDHVPTVDLTSGRIIVDLPAEEDDDPS